MSHDIRIDDIVVAPALASGNNLLIGGAAGTLRAIAPRKCRLVAAYSLVLTSFTGDEVVTFGDGTNDLADTLTVGTGAAGAVTEATFREESNNAFDENEIIQCAGDGGGGGGAAGLFLVLRPL